MLTRSHLILMTALMAAMLGACRKTPTENTDNAAAPSTLASAPAQPAQPRAPMAPSTGATSSMPDAAAPNSAHGASTGAGAMSAPDGNMPSPSNPASPSNK